MKRIVFLVFMVFFSTVLLWGESFGFRCGRWLISKGDSQFEVLAKCGEPDFVETWYEERLVRDYYNPYLFDEKYEYYYRGYREPIFTREPVVIERWTYNLGPRQFIRYLRFYNGTLTHIITGDYGY